MTSPTHPNKEEKKKHQPSSHPPTHPPPTGGVRTDILDLLEMKTNAQTAKAEEKTLSPTTTQARLLLCGFPHGDLSEFKESGNPPTHPPTHPPTYPRHVTYAKKIEGYALLLLTHPPSYPLGGGVLAVDCLIYFFAHPSNPPTHPPTHPLHPGGGVLAVDCLIYSFAHLSPPNPPTHPIHTKQAVAC